MKFVAWNETSVTSMAVAQQEPIMWTELAKHKVFKSLDEICKGRSQFTNLPRQLEALIHLAEAHTKMESSNTVDLDKIDAEEAMRRHCATDLLSCKIDVSSKTTHVSDNSRKRRHQEEEGDSSKKLATDATGQDHIAQGPKTGKGKAGRGLKAKNAETFGKKVQDKYAFIPDLPPTAAR